MPKFKIPEAEIQLSYSRSSGAGGQNVNKVNSKVTLHWNALLTSALPPAVLDRFLKKFGNKLSSEGVLTIISQIHRSQNLNASDAIQKLQAMIDSVSIPPKLRKPTKPSKSSVLKRISSKKNHGEKKKLRSEKF